MYTLMPGKEIRLAAICMCFLLCLSLQAAFAFPGLEVETGIGHEYGWDLIESSRLLTFTEGRQGFRALTLDEQSYEPGPQTDLLLDYQDTLLTDQAGRYRVVVHDAQPTRDQAIRGDSGIRFRGGGEGVTLDSRPGALFHPGRVWDAFSIEFLMQPARTSDGDEILFWAGTLVVDDEILSQTVRVFFERRRLVWEFENVFVLPDLEPFTVRMESFEPLTPRRSAHHQLRFDPRSGSLTYLVDGVPEDVRHVTESGAPGSTVRIPVSGSGAGQVRVGRGFSGVLDAVRIEEQYVTEPDLTPFGADAGVLITQPIDLGRDGSQPVSIRVDARQPEGSDLAVYYRVFSTSDNRNTMPWIPLNGTFSPDTPVTGRFVQMRVEMYADGRGTRSPVLDAIRIRYLPSRPPGPPAAVRAFSGDGSVILRWDHAPGDGITGYDIFYGNRPGEYFGEHADQGRSPVSVGYVTEFELTGLRNGRAYFFAIVARDGTDTRDGMFSSEVEVRPNP